MTKPLPLPGAYLLTPDRFKDERGCYDCTFRNLWAGSHGIDTNFVEFGVSYNAKAGTVRGLHFQRFPETQGKLIRCIHGSIMDIIVDLRPQSSTYLAHMKIQLDAWSHCGVYIPPGFAHGFQTLTDHARVEYFMTKIYSPLLSDGVRWNDPSFGIELPLPVTMVATRDMSYPDYEVQR